MRIIIILLILISSFSIIGFASAYQTFSVINGDYSDKQAVIIVNLNPAEVVEPYPIIKLDVSEIEVNGYEELLNFANENNIEAFFVYSRDTQAVEQGQTIRRRGGMPVLVKITSQEISNNQSAYMPQSQNIINDKEVVENKSIEENKSVSFTAITGNAIQQEEPKTNTNIYGYLIIGGCILIGFIILGLILRKR